MESNQLVQPRSPGYSRGPYHYGGISILLLNQQDTLFSLINRKFLIAECILKLVGD